MASSIFAPSFRTSFAPTQDELNAIDGEREGSGYSLDLAYVPTMIETTDRASGNVRRVCRACAAHLSAARVTAKIVNVASACANGSDCLHNAPLAPLAPMERLGRVLNARA